MANAVPTFEIARWGFHSEISMNGQFKETIAWDCRDDHNCTRAKALVRGWLRTFRESALNNGDADAYNAADRQLREFA
jgi:hypothetical protein